MITVAEAVNEVLSEDGLIIEALQRGVLNISAYAKEILAEVELRTKKPVRVGTVIVALSRLADRIDRQPIMASKVAIESYSVATGLSNISYDKTGQVMADLSLVNHSFIENANAFWTITMGRNDFALICSSGIAPRIVGSIGIQPKARADAMAAISVRFCDKYLETPSAIYSLVGAMALRQINVWEIVSAYTEVIFIIHESEVEAAISALQAYQRKVRGGK